MIERSFARWAPGPNLTSSPCSAVDTIERYNGIRDNVLGLPPHSKDQNAEGLRRPG
jgi:hypothetical protein